MGVFSGVIEQAANELNESWIRRGSSYFLTLPVPPALILPVFDEFAMELLTAEAALQECRTV